MTYEKTDCFCGIGTRLKNIAMNKSADPRLVWVASVLAAAVLVLYITHI